MKLPSLTIGPFTATIPLIQGGMSIRVSTAALAAPVAECGGIGVIGGSGIPADELRADILKAKKMTRGVIAANIMFAMRDFHELVMAAVGAGVDIIITGAGFSRDIFKIGREHNVPIVPIVSSPAFAILAEKLGASAIIVEAKEAGGHLGTDLPLREIFPEIRKVVSKVPLIAAGGISDGYEMAEIMDKYGADGVQIATRFVMTKECDVSEAFKQAFVQAKAEDVTVMRSPVGMPGRAIRNTFIKKLQAGDKSLRPETCEFKCLRKCDYVYCINDRLTRAACQGDVENGLIFSGEKVYKFNDIITVQQVFDQFVSEAESVYKESAPAA